MTFATFLANFSMFLPMVMAMAIIFTWVFNHTGGSVFIAIVLHASINTLTYLIPLFPVPVVTNTDLALLIGVAPPALLIVILTRGRIGYQPGQEASVWPVENAGQALP